MKKLSNKCQTALNLLQGGAEFKYGLETGWQGREQFQWSLVLKGKKIKGFGGATYKALCDAGYEFTRKPSGFTGSWTYYALKGGA